jgi:carbon storage regulator
MNERFDDQRIQGGIVMLVLSRKIGQSFRLGDDVRITIVRIDHNSVRIGIEAPDSITVRRQEITDSELTRSSNRHADVTAA